ncbi:unnamed protein product [Polarella glacialis]|uniref:Uncharacterized protein n=1 Tax=Polarella glacialis TaxID=89957 RepID=A0A813HAA4_POLGL|nr:unnamed protein product [Polarella glacialis]
MRLWLMGTLLQCWLCLLGSCGRACALPGSWRAQTAPCRRLVLLEEELLKVKGDLQKARSFYLKELTTLRDQLRRLDGHWEAEVIRLVYEEEPVMYYEPLQYLDEALKEHVVQIVEEKLKLAVARLQRLSESDASAASAAFMTALEEKSSRSPMLPKQKGQQSEEEAEAAAEMADKAIDVSFGVRLTAVAVEVPEGSGGKTMLTMPYL